MNDYIVGAHGLDASELPSLLVPPPSSYWGLKQMRLNNHLHFPNHDQFYQYPGSKTSFQGENPLSSGIADCCSLTFTYNVGGSENFCFGNLNPDFDFLDWRALEPKGNESSLAQQNHIDKYKLFGVNLINSPTTELPSPQVASSSELQSPCSIPPMSQSSFSESLEASEPSKSVSGDLSDKQCKNCCSILSRSCTKVA